MRIIRAPHHIIHPNDVAVLDAQSVFLEAAKDIPVKEVAGQEVTLEAVPMGSAGLLRVGVVDAIQEVRDPGSQLFSSPSRYFSFCASSSRAAPAILNGFVMAGAGRFSTVSTADLW